MTLETVAPVAERPPERPALSLLPLFRKELGDSRIGLLAWTIGNAAAILLYLPFYPSIGGNREMQSFFTDFPPEVVTLFGLDQLYSGPAYTQATYFGLTGFLLLAIAAVSWGAAAIAGAEETGELELTLAHGVTRGQVVSEKAAALLARVLWLAASAALVIAALNGPSALELTLAGLLGVSAALAGLAFLTGMAALFAGALSGRRSLATAAGAGVAVLAYVLDALAKTTGSAWLGRLSPVNWAYGRNPIVDGPDWPGLALLLGAAALLWVGAVLVFRRRDVGV